MVAWLRGNLLATATLEGGLTGRYGVRPSIVGELDAPHSIAAQSQATKRSYSDSQRSNEMHL